MSLLAVLSIEKVALNQLCSIAGNHSVMLSEMLFLLTL